MVCRLSHHEIKISIYPICFLVELSGAHVPIQRVDKDVSKICNHELIRWPRHHDRLRKLLTRSELVAKTDGTAFDSNYAMMLRDAGKPNDLGVTRGNIIGRLSRWYAKP